MQHEINSTIQKESKLRSSILGRMRPWHPDSYAPGNESTVLYDGGPVLLRLHSDSRAWPVTDAFTSLPDVISAGTREKSFRPSLHSPTVKKIFTDTVHFGRTMKYLLGEAIPTL